MRPEGGHSPDLDLNLDPELETYRIDDFLGTLGSERFARGTMPPFEIVEEVEVSELTRLDDVLHLEDSARARAFDGDTAELLEPTAEPAAHGWGAIAGVLAVAVAIAIAVLIAALRMAQAPEPSPVFPVDDPPVVDRVTSTAAATEFPRAIVVVPVPKTEVTALPAATIEAGSVED